MEGLKDSLACGRCRHPIIEDIHKERFGELEVREWYHVRLSILVSSPPTAERPYEPTAILTMRCGSRFCLCRRPTPVVKPGSLPFFMVNVWEAKALEKHGHVFTYRKLKPISSGGPRYPDTFDAIAALRKGLIRSRVGEVRIVYLGLVKPNRMIDESTVSSTVWIRDLLPYSVAGFLSEDDQISSFMKNGGVKTPGTGNTLIEYGITTTPRGPSK